MKQFELLSGSCTYSKSSSTLCLLTERGSRRLVSVGEEHFRGSLFRKERKVRSSSDFSLTDIRGVDLHVWMDAHYVAVGFCICFSDVSKVPHYAEHFSYLPFNLSGYHRLNSHNYSLLPWILPTSEETSAACYCLQRCFIYCGGKICHLQRQVASHRTASVCLKPTSLHPIHLPVISISFCMKKIMVVFGPAELELVIKRKLWVLRFVWTRQMPPQWSSVQMVNMKRWENRVKR